MDKLIKAIFQLRDLKIRTDDDFVDRLNRQYTPGVLVLFAVLISVKQYVGDPINCWVPAQFTPSHLSYANTVCWVSNTYYVPFNVAMPHVTEPRHMISYYQWVPLILVSQALLYFLPCLLWRFLNRRIGLNLPSIIEASRATQKAIFPETREKSIRYVVMQIDSHLTSSMRRHVPASGPTYGLCSRLALVLSRSCCLSRCKIYGNYLTCCYLCTKLLYLANGVGQLWLLDMFLGFNHSYQLYGLQVLAQFLRGDDWSSSERFPRVTLCDFEIRQQTNVHRFTVQCVLPINLFNEKIFIFIWFWLFAMAVVSLVSIVHWLTRQTIVSTQSAYVRRQLSSMDTITKREHRATREFTENYLRRDGLLIMRLIANNAGGLVAADVLHGLWTNYGPEKRGLGDLGTASTSRAGRPPHQIGGEHRGHGIWSRVKRFLVGGKPTVNVDNSHAFPEDI